MKVGMTTALSAVDDYLRELVSRVREVADGNLVGIYAGGSYALGAYEPGRSDIDVASVVSAPPSRATTEALVDAIRHESLPCPARGLEFVLYALDDIRDPSAEARYRLNLNTGGGMSFRADLEPNGNETHWFPIDRSVLRQRGVALVGPRPEEVFAPLGHRRLLPLLLESLSWHSTGAARADDAVLNACRAWRYAVEGVWSSKPAGGTWALAQPGAPPIVADALAARHGDGMLDPIAVDAALRTARKEIEKVLAEATG
jgi:predicted nucleotidyltransferase